MLQRAIFSCYDEMEIGAAHVYSDDGDAHTGSAKETLISSGFPKGYKEVRDEEKIACHGADAHHVPVLRRLR
jgi:hypothetical protein